MERENYIRKYLREEGWSVRAETDSQVKTQLNLQGKVSDFVGTKNGQFLVAESKGVKVGRAVSQLENTVNGLYRSNSSATLNNTQARLYVNQNSWNQLTQKQWLDGYRVHNGRLQWFDNTNMTWVNQTAGNVPIQVFVVP